MKMLDLTLCLFLLIPLFAFAGVLDVVSHGGDIASKTFKESVREALKEGNVNERDAEGNTALLKMLKLYLPGISSDENDTTALKLLLDAGADCEVCGSDGMTPLVWATELCMLEPLRVLAQASTCLRAYNNSGNSLREIAQANEDEKILLQSSLVAQFIQTLEEPLNTPFDRACYYARTGQAGLLKQWANNEMARTCDENGRTLLHLATLSGDQATIAIAAKLGCKSDALDFYFQRADGAPSQVQPLSAQHSSPSLKEKRDLPSLWYVWLHGREPDLLPGEAISNLALPPPHQGSLLLHFARDISVNQVQTLLEQGLDPNAKDSQGYTPADYLLAWERAKMRHPTSFFACLSRLNILMAYGAKVDAATKQWDLSIQDTGTTQPQLDIAKRYVISLLMDGEVSENWHGTVTDALLQEIRREQDKLMTAVFAGDSESLWKLLESISPDFFRNGYTPLQHAILAGQDEVAKTLIRDGGLLSLLSKDKKTALGLAIEQGRPLLLRELCKQDPTLAAQPTFDTKSQRCIAPLMLALSLQNTSAIKVLLGARENRKEFDWQRDDALIKAADADNFELCKLLLTEGASCTYQNEDGNTALHMAKSAAVATLLLDAGSKINLANHYGKTPLHTAAVLKNPGPADALLNRLAPVDMISSDGYTPLLAAISSSAEATALAIVDYGASLTQFDLNGRTPLMLAAERGLTRLMKLLISRNAALNAVDFAGNTALHLATQNAQLEAAKLLLNAGCLPTAQNLEGKTPLAIANAQRNKGIARAILAKTSTPSLLDWIFAITQIGIGVALLGVATSLMAQSGGLLLKEQYSNHLLPAFITPPRACVTAFTSSFLVASPNAYNFISGAYWEKDRLPMRSYLTGISWAGLGSLSLMLALGYNLTPLHKILIGALGLWYYLGWPRIAKPWLVLFLGIGMGLLGASFIKGTAAILAGAPLTTQAMDLAATNPPIAILLGAGLALFFQSSASIGITIAAFSLTGVIGAETVLLCLGGGMLGSVLNGWLWSEAKDSRWNSVARWARVMSFGSACLVFCDWLLETYLHVPLAIALVEWAFSSLFLQQLGLVLIFGVTQASLIAIFFPRIFAFFDRHWYFYKSFPNDNPRFLPTTLQDGSILPPLQQEQEDLHKRLLQYFSVKDEGRRTALKALDGKHRNFKRIFLACEDYISKAKSASISAADLRAASLRQRRLDILERSTYQVARFATTEDCKNRIQWQDLGRNLLETSEWQAEQVQLALAHLNPAERANLLCLLEQMEEDAKELKN